MRNASINTKDGYLDVLEKVAVVMKRPNQQVEMGYEAPWSAKIGTKKCLAYIASEDDLDEFWIAYAAHCKKQNAKKKANADATSGIIFKNMRDSLQVCVRAKFRGTSHVLNISRPSNQQVVR